MIYDILNYIFSEGFLKPLIASALGTGFVFPFILSMQRHRQAKNIEAVKNELRSELLKYEAHTAVSKETFQSLFLERINFYRDLLILRGEIENSFVNDAHNIELENTISFTLAVEKICELSQEKLLIMSAELGKITRGLIYINNEIQSQKNIREMEIEIYAKSDQDKFEGFINLDDETSRITIKRCHELYDSWMTQLDEDVSKVCRILDVSNSILEFASSKDRG